LSQAGKQTVQLQGGAERKFLLNGDTITLRGCCDDNDDALVGFGECTGKIMPSPIV
jgi:fumarylacetoacetase